MGHQIYDDGDYGLGVCFTRGAWQVINWCETFTPRQKPDDMPEWRWHDQIMGSSEASAASVRTADERVPRRYIDAQSQGLINDGITEDDFRQCRNFLAEVARRGVGIAGSY